MKALTCEMCGSTNIVKEDGVFVCQSCGTKYSVEEAKKMMISGTIKIDNSDELKNLYEIARRAKNSNNYGDAAKYYEMILLKEPSSWEACFYAPYFKTMDSDIDNISIAASNIDNNIKTVLSLLKNNSNEEDDVSDYLSEITDKLIHIGQLFYNAAIDYYNMHSKARDAANNCAEDLYAAGHIGYSLGDSIVELFGRGYCDKLVIKAWSHGINCNDGAQSVYRKASGSIISPNNAIAQKYRKMISSLSPHAKVEDSFIQKKGCIGMLAIIIAPIIAFLSCVIGIYYVIL